MCDHRSVLFGRWLAIKLPFEKISQTTWSWQNNFILLSYLGSAWCRFYLAQTVKIKAKRNPKIKLVSNKRSLEVNNFHNKTHARKPFVSPRRQAKHRKSCRAHRSHTKFCRETLRLAEKVLIRQRTRELSALWIFSTIIVLCAVLFYRNFLSQSPQRLVTEFGVRSTRSLFSVCFKIRDAH